MPTTVQFHTRLPPAVLDLLRHQASNRRWSAALLGAVLIEEGLEKMTGGSVSAALAAPVKPALEASDEVIIGRSLEISNALGISSAKARAVIKEIMLKGSPFRDILTIEDARAIGPKDWLQAGATKLVTQRLFPEAKWAHEVAFQNQTARYNASRNQKYQAGEYKRKRASNSPPPPP
jgi:hypothetical protein